MYSPVEGNEQWFCAECGTYLYWHKAGLDRLSILAPTVDALYLFGEGADGVEVPEGGFGRALCSGLGGSEWCKNEIKGITDNIPLLFRGPRFEGNG
jgi:hypothetical protein